MTRIMGAMQNAFDVLQLTHVLAKVSTFARTEQAKAALSSLRPLEAEDRRRETAHLDEAFKLIDLGGPLPLSESVDMGKRVELAVKGGVLREEDFSRVLNDLEMARSIKKYLSHVTMNNTLTERVLSLMDLESLRQGILRVLAPDLSIKDNASVELKRIRSTLSRKKREIAARLGSLLEENRSYLSGDSWTMRNGHYVLPVSNTYKHQVKGLVQDVSSSGGTTFIEPEFLVKLHNDIALLEAEEKEEIRRILTSLTRLLANNAKDYMTINETIGYLDFLQAKCLYGAEVNGHIGSESHDGSLFIPQARHPLIDPKKVVANDFALSAARPILVLSGPNAGGKTVALKTLGILCMMFMMALPLPCASGAEIPSFSAVYLDIGDSQSIFDNLSTFSGHVQNIKDILNVAKKGDLVLLDEVGTGTSPKEGEALALAILDELRLRGCYALLSSHFEGLKAHALSSTDVENASLLFDEKTLSPTYVLKVGLPGESYGLEVARRLGLGESVLSRAKKYLDEEEDLSVSASLKHLGELAHEAEEKQKTIDELLVRTRQKEIEIARKENDINRKTKRFEEETKRLREEILEQAKEEVAEAISALRDPDVKLHEAIAAKKKLEALEEEQSKELIDAEINVGDYVEIPSFEVEGRVRRLRGERAEVVTRDGLTFTLSKKELRPIEAPKEEKRVSVTNVDALPSKGLPLEVNLIGMRVAEAMSELDRYLDRCRLKGYKRVRVIHGLGSGALRKATHEYLKAHSSFVDRYELGGEYEGGGGATVVYLK